MLSRSLTASRKGEGLLHRQLCKVCVVLGHIACCAHWHKLIKRAATVSDAAVYLHLNSRILSRGPQARR